MVGRLAKPWLLALGLLALGGGAGRAAAPSDNGAPDADATAPPTVQELERSLIQLESDRGADHLSCANLHDDLTAALTADGDFAGALAHAQRAVQVRTLHLPADHEDLAVSVQEVGYAYYRLEDYAEAAFFLQDALGRWLSTDDVDPSDVVWCESDLAEMLRLAGEFDEAESALRSALVRARGERAAAAFVPVLVNNLGTFLWDQDRLDEAEPLLRESLVLREAEDPRAPLRVATAHLNLGVILRSQSDYTEAELHLESALGIAREFGENDPGVLVHYLNGLAGVYSLTARFEEARDLRLESLEILARRESPAHVLETDILHALGADLLAHGDLGPAERTIRRGLELRRRTLGDDHPSVGVDLVGLALVRARRTSIGNEEIGELLDQALARLGDAPVSIGERARALSLRARHLRARGQRELARRTMGEALETAETLRVSRGGGDESRLALVTEFRAAACGLVDWLVADGEVWAAFREAESIKARLLRDQIGAARVNLRAGIPETVLAPLEREETAALIRVSELRRAMRYVESYGTEAARQRHLSDELDAAVGRLRDVTDRIKLHSPAWKRVLRETGAEATEAAVRELALDDGEALLAFQVGPEHSWAFVVPPGRGDVQAHELDLTQVSLAAILAGDPGLEVLHRPRGAIRGVSGTALIGEQVVVPVEEALLRRLATLLLPARVRESLEGVTGVVVVPDGRLHSVPMEALILSAPGRRTEYWLDQGPPIRYAHSVGTLLQSTSGVRHSSAVGAGPVVSFVDPMFAAAGRASLLPALPGTAREGDAVVSSFGVEQVRMFRGAEATEAAFREHASASRWLHVATHALVDPKRSDWLSALVLAPGEGTEHDGFVHLYELLDLRVSCEVAVLSACDTNAGRLVEGEGVFALSRGFLVAGAVHVAGLWPLHDDAAAELTGAFFAHIAGSPSAGTGTPIPASRYADWLREAKRTLRASERFSAPHFWAPFVLTVGVGSS